MERGRIYAARIPGQKKSRPVLVISTDVRNSLSHDVLVVPLTTNLREGPVHVRLKKGVGGVREASMARCENLTALERRWLDEEPYGPRVPADLLDEVVRAVVLSIGGCHLLLRRG